MGGRRDTYVQQPKEQRYTRGQITKLLEYIGKFTLAPWAGEFRTEQGILARRALE